MSRTLRALAGLLLIPAALWAADVVLKTFVLKHRDVRSVVARVSQELGPRGRISVDGERNRISVEDDGAAVARITALLEELDRPVRRFALAARLDLFPAPPKAPLFKEQPGFVDMGSWTASSKPSRSFEAVLNFQEGGSASSPFGDDYGLSLSAGGYDPTQRRLGLKNLHLWKGSGPKRVTVLSGAAALTEGQATALLVGGTEGHPPLRLHMTPALLPAVEQRKG